LSVVALGTDVAGRRAAATHSGAVSSDIVLARNIDIFNLVTVLDELRESYDLAKQAQLPELQAHLMLARRLLLATLRHNVDLHSELFDLQARLAESQAETERLRVSGDSALAELAIRGTASRLS
jgi:hypothetical protein